MGTPTDCVYLGVNALMRPRPDIVVSGINAGPNLGDDVIYSGTVAAAMEGRHLGFPALAVSLNGHQHYDTAAAITCSILRALGREPLRTGRILNINVPDLPLEQIKGIRVTRAAAEHPADQVIPQKIRAAIRCTGLARRERSTMPGRIPILRPSMKAMSP